jgi:DNA repair protein RAD57
MLNNVHTRDITEVDGLDHALTYIVPATIGRIAAQSASSSDVLPVRLLVIDSIGALFRATYSSNHSGLTQRSKMLCAITDKLKELAEVHDIAVVVVNQVTDVFTQDRSRRLVQAPDTPSSGSAGGVSVPVIEDDHGEPIMTYKNQSRSFSGQTQELSKEASLGLVWANGVNVRLMLSRTGRRRPLDHQDLRRRRHRATALEKEEADRSAEGQWQSTLIRRMHLVFSPFAPEARVDYIILDAGIRSVSDVQIHQPPDTMPSLADNGGIQSIPHDDDEFAGDLLDDLGELPAEFWTGEAFEEARGEAVERNALKQQEQGFTLGTDDVLAEDAASTPAPVATQAAEADGFAGTPDDVEP